MIWEALPETLHPTFILAVPLLDMVSIPEGLMLPHQTIPLERPAVPRRPIHQDERLILTPTQDQHQEIEGIERRPTHRNVHRQDDVILDVNRVPDVDLPALPLHLRLIHSDHRSLFALRTETRSALLVPFPQRHMGERFEIPNDRAGLPIGETSIVDQKSDYFRLVTCPLPYKDFSIF